MKTWLLGTAKRFAVFLVLLVVGGFAVAASGVVPIKASSGHWPITAWFLNFSMKRSVKTHTLGMNVPPLGEPLLILKGAGHYETACRPCHGSPDLHGPRIAGAMRPFPPDLKQMVPQWESKELFYIVKHGVKFTGMPAWPTQERDDEVWAMAAFLRAYPGIDADEYRQLVHGERAAEAEVAPVEGLIQPDSVPHAIAQSCGRCHGDDGGGRGLGAFPTLAGQSPVYLEASLRAYSNGERHSGVMEPIAAGLNQAEWQAIADHYGALRASEVPFENSAPDAEAIARGELIARKGDPSRRVPACVACHGPGKSPRNAHYPRLAGQYAEYLVLQLEVFKREQRGGSGFAHLMHPVASRLTEQQMRDVALYYESLGTGLGSNSP